MTPEERLDRRFELLYRADYSARYHRRRSTFLCNLDTLLTLITVAAGASAFGDLVSGSPGWLAKVGAATVTLISLAQILLRLGYAGQQHAGWLKRWCTMHADLDLTSDPSDADIRRWRQEAAAIEQECIGELRALRTDCEDETSRVMRLPGRQHQIGWFQRLLIHFGTFQMSFPLLPDEGQPVRHH